MKNLNLNFNFFLKVPLAEKMLFAKHLSMMIKSGMAEVESINLIRSQVKSRGFGSILDDVIVKIQNGQLLSEALEQYKNIFGDLFVSIIRVGEISGTLPESLNYLAGELQKSQQLRSKVRSALIYPAVILVATLAVVAALVFFILPKIMPVFLAMKIDLPITTKILIGVSNMLQNDFLYIVIGLFVFIIGLSFLMRLPGIKKFYDKTLLYLPVVGSITVSYNMANISRTFALLLKNGVKIVEAISITSTIVANTAYKQVLKEASEEVRKGEMFYRSLERYSKYFPGTLTRMIEVGEKTGNLDSNLFYLSEYYENELDETTKNLSSILEPVLLVVMGVIVGFVVLAIITPIYSLTQNIKVK